jgi:hypothetical protein
VQRKEPKLTGRAEIDLPEARAQKLVPTLLIPVEEIADACVVIRRQILAWADEARTLLDTL